MIITMERPIPRRRGAKAARRFFLPSPLANARSLGRTLATRPAPRSLRGPLAPPRFPARIS